MQRDEARALNDNLEGIAASIRSIGVIHTNTLKITAANFDMMFLTIRALAQTNVDFRTVLLNLSQEPAVNPNAEEFRGLLRTLLADMQRNSGERPTLKPVE